LESILDAGIAGLWGELPSTPAPAAVPSPDMPAPDLTRQNQADAALGQYIASRINDDFHPLAAKCYENALAQSPALHGRVTLQFKIVGDRRVGAVVDAADVDNSSDITDPLFLECLTESMKTVNFAAPPDGTQAITSRFSMRFAPAGD
jgi:hypothetical protein